MTQIKITEKCSRCPREESFAVDIDEAVARVKNPQPKQKALVIMIDGEQTVSYDYLCEECRGIVTSYCDGTKKQPKRSARRFKRVVDDMPARSKPSSAVG